MMVIPAIDLRGGRCVRLIQGDRAHELLYSDDPVAVARHWAGQGARWLHVVDLDGAFAGRPVQLDLIRAIAAATSLPVQVGGGFRTSADLAAGFHAGASRIILGTAAPALAAEATRLGDRVVASVDVKDGQVTEQGWTVQTGREPTAAARSLIEMGFSRLIYTDARRDGTLEGIDAEAVRHFAREVGVPVIAAGGIASEADLAALASTGVEGVIVGRALYEGRIDLRAAARFDGAPC
ncbi:MAG: 1-(5-phosphoribosyl)-5-[(5-phosphoribosylamino)methylideneamino]imidazole-4-carboxamide isomerase [Armatimonadetes bacterium 13_1_40CM_64_14]|nr:MAG: 1-(5-phosphoribosyl)-5-[(5-phosphoribosylamino)methylideneamino]imidazole-4-carboxamide isomerase [Armatimonadetes bacterium 13_1_40CM_64_14]